MQPERPLKVVLLIIGLSIIPGFLLFEDSVSLEERLLLVSLALLLSVLLPGLRPQRHHEESPFVAPVRSPGDGLRRLAEFLFSKKTYNRVFKPTLSDLWIEYVEALGANRPWKARMVWIRGYWSFWTAFIAQLPLSLLRMVVELWKTSKIG